MAVFRLTTDSNRADGKDWFSSTRYSSEEISGICDPEGGKGNDPSSIPTPFARLYLVNTAFRNVGKDRSSTHNNGTYGKIVSDCLDVAEMFFRQKSLNKEQLTIGNWNRKRSMERLYQSKLEGHKRLYKVLNMYFTDDDKTFNFRDIESFHLIKFNHKIIGGTSPLTLFFSTANDLGWIEREVQFPNSDVAFDNEYCPLYERDADFQLWLYSMRKSFENFSILFKELSRYMDVCLEELPYHDSNLYNKINELTPDYYNSEYEDCNINVVNGLNLKIGKGEIDMKASDFKMQPTKEIQDKCTPLALVNGHNGKKSNGDRMKYQNGYYDDARVEIPFSDTRPLNERILPGLGCTHPYLTTDDFLERHIIKTSDKIDNKRFYCFELKNNKQFDYLLPIKRLYFDYFTIEDLKKHISINSLVGGSVQIKLQIPLVHNEYINYERTYYPGDAAREKDKGQIIDVDSFNISIYPFLKINNIESSYSVGLFDVCKDNEAFKLEFYKEAQNHVLAEDSVKRIHRSKKTDTQPNSRYHVLEKSNFDYIEMCYNNKYKAILIPEFDSREMGNDAFTFAIDFGTSNTHIEYSVDGNSPKPLEISGNDTQIGHLFSIEKISAPQLTRITVNEMLPNEIKAGCNFSFPVRTALIANSGFNFDNPIYPFANVNMSFVYEKLAGLENAKTHLNLKWAKYANNEGEKMKIKAYLSNIMLLIRNKILLNDGDLSKTNLVWLYPSSMPTNMYNKLNDMWDEVYKKYITENNSPISMSESIAPFFYHQKNAKINAYDSSVVSIDIGGGTTDVAIYLDNKPQLLTSFKFAANSIFGDIGVGKAENGFMLKYTESINKRVETLPELTKIFEDIQGRPSEDMATFLFSLENNYDVKGKNLDVSFNKILSDDDDFRIVFLTFYSSIIYHIASIFKIEENLTIPRHIRFSGNGSKVIKIAAGTQRVTDLQKLTRIIFNKVLGRDCNNIEIKLEENPKVISSKGGIYGKDNTASDITSLRAITKILRGDLSEDETTIKEIGDCRNSPIVEAVIKEYKNFTNMLVEIDQQMKFEELFGLNKDSMTLFRDVMMEDSDLKNHIMTGLNESGSKDDDKLTETIFFYPIVRNINKLASVIYNNQNNLEKD